MADDNSLQKEVVADDNSLQKEDVKDELQKEKEDVDDDLQKDTAIKFHVIAGKNWVRCFVLPYNLVN